MMVIVVVFVVGDHCIARTTLSNIFISLREAEEMFGC